MSAISKYSNYSQFQQCNSKLNKMITFDKSGTIGQIIGSDGTNGLVWVDSDPSSAATWSEYPATQTVDIADNNIENVDTIELINIIDSSGSSGTDTQLLSQNTTGALWIDQSDVIEKWSEYPATQTVDIANNDVENVNNLTANKIKIGELSYQSAFPIGIEVAFDENTFTTGIIAQNKDSADASSVSILLTNDLGTDSAYYGGLTMFSSNTVPTYGFPSIKNAISLNSQSSSVVISPWNGQQHGTANENGNIMLTYSGGSKAHIINNNGQLILGADNPDYSGSTYGGDNGQTDKVLTSDGTNGLKWVDPEYASLWSEYPATQTVDISGNDISDVKDIGITGTISNNAKLALNFDVNNPAISMINSVASMNIQNGSMNITNASNGYQTNMFSGNRINVQDSTGTYQCNLTPPTNDNYNQLFEGAGVNSKILLGVPNNNPALLLSNSGQNIYSRSDLTSLAYNNGTIETAKLNATAGTLTLNDGTNTSILSRTNLTFNGISYSRNMINSSLVYSSALIYADGSLPATNLLIRNSYSYNGWYFAKTLPGTAKINWYLGAQSNDTTVSEIKGIAMSFFNELATSNDYLPFITIYTQPQSGDPFFFRSRRIYIFDQALTPTVNTAYQGCVFVDPTLIPYYRETQVQYELSPVGQVGPFASNEKILAIVIGSDSAAPVNGTGFVVSKLNIIYDTFTQELQFVPP
jgi:hypothetical protein